MADSISLALDFDRGMDGLAENDLIDEAEVDSVIRETVIHTIGEASFAQGKVDAWSSHILEGCLKKLAAMGKPFKYVVTCSITQVRHCAPVHVYCACLSLASARSPKTAGFARAMQRAGTGLHAAACMRWNPKTDGKLGVHWESETVLALVTIYWAAV
jgi:dynein light chain Tctex-type 1